MTPDTRSSVLYGDPDFDTVLENVCGRLENKQIEFSVRRLRELEARLEVLEQELDAFILGKGAGGIPAGGCGDGVPGVKAAPVTHNAE
jgi:hypothetical protein